MQYLTPDEEAKELAKELIESINTITKVDYTEHNELIANEIAEYVFHGNWDHTIVIDNLQNLRIIQEDEYEQSMDEEDQPQDAFFTCGYYIVLEG